LETSILTSTKKILGIDQTYTVFDLDIITHINSAFSTLTQLGVGPAAGFMIEDETPTWSDFITDGDLQYNAVKSYIYLKTRQLFDPPTTSYLIAAFNDQIKEIEWRLNVHREETGWTDPDPPGPPVEIPPDSPTAVINSLSPANGTPNGGVTSTLTGLGLSGVINVYFGDINAASFTIIDDTQLTCVSPAHPAGQVMVTVEDVNGFSNPLSYTFM